MTDLKTIDFSISDELVGFRLDRVLATLEEVGSRSRAAQLIQKGMVTGVRKDLKASTSVRLGEVYQIRIPATDSLEIKGYDFPIECVYEDEDLLVVNKPAGLVVHPAAGHHDDTLVNALVDKVKDLSMGFGERRPGIVHRLDKDTSGLLVVAKNDKTQAGLVEQFKARSIHRLYRAIVFGVPRKPSDILQSHLLRHPVHRKRFCSERLTLGREPNGKVAITSYTLKKAFNESLSLLECRLKTGRTHQIRVHLSELGHPIVGDLLYGSSARTNRLKNQKLKAFIKSMERIALHAAELGFLHPIKGTNLSFKSNWPEDLKTLIEDWDWTDVGD